MIALPQDLMPRVREIARAAALALAVVAAAGAEAGNARLGSAARAVAPVAAARTDAPASPPTAAVPAESAPYAKLIAQYHEAVVRLRFVVTVNANGQEARQEGEASAILVSPDGLVLVADGVVNLRNAWLGAAAPGMELPDPKISELRVRAAGYDEDFAAELVTRDADLGLAWIKLASPPGELVHVDFADAVEPTIGAIYYTLARTSADFGAEVIAGHGYVIGETDTPSKSYLATPGALDLAFDAAGRPLGFVTRYRTRDWRYSSQFGGVVPSQLIAARRVARATAQAAEIAKRPKPKF